MAHIALLDADDGTAIAVRAALGADAVVAYRAGDSVPVGVSLVITEVGSAAAVRKVALQLPDGFAPLLLLADRPLTVDASAFGAREVAVLQKPFDLLDLRRTVRALLDASASSTAASISASGWFAPPRVTADAAATLSAAARLDGAVWIVGEAGTGTDQVAAALAAAWDPHHEPVVWQESDSLAASVARLDDAGRVLWVPAIDERPLREQKAFERYLALEPQRRVAVTCADDPETAVGAGTLLRSLHDGLSRVSLRLAPLRERRGEVVALATSIATAVATRAFAAERVVWTDDARRTLESYPWPGNVIELDAVVTRSTIAAGAPGSQVIELDAGDLRFLPGHLRAASGELTTLADPASPSVAANAPVAPSRRAVVVPLGDMAAARAAKPSDTTSTDVTQAIGMATVPSPAQEQHPGVEALLAAFAHDIRNPMSTIKTFAGLQAASAGADDSELARLAIEACQRVDEHLEFLQRFAELTGTAPGLIDVVETLGQAIDAAVGSTAEPVPLAIAARRALWVRTDASLARFVADAVVAECRARAAAPGSAGPAEADTVESPAAASAGSSAGSAAIEIRIPVGSAAVDRLDKWVEGASLPWRLALAREAARRGGGDLQVDVEDGQMRLLWRLPSRVDGEEGNHDDQAGSPDRRRRSRSS